MGFRAGYNSPVTFRPDGQNETATLNVTGHSWSEMVDKLVADHSGTGGLQALLAGVLRGDGNVKANMDAAAYPWASPLPFIRAGVNGVISFYYGAFYAVPCMVIKINKQSEVNGLIVFDFDVSLNCLAGSGADSIVRPGNQPN